MGQKQSLPVATRRSVPLKEGRKPSDSPHGLMTQYLKKYNISFLNSFDDLSSSVVVDDSRTQFSFQSSRRAGD
jgi:hypothetical protein